MVEVFKTNVQKKAQSKMLLCILSEAFPSFKINFDQQDRKPDSASKSQGKAFGMEKIVNAKTDFKVSQ